MKLGAGAVVGRAVDAVEGDAEGARELDTGGGIEPGRAAVKIGRLAMEGEIGQGVVAIVADRDIDADSSGPMQVAGMPADRGSHERIADGGERIVGVADICGAQQRAGEAETGIDARPADRKRRRQREVACTSATRAPWKGNGTPALALPL